MTDQYRKRSSWLKNRKLQPKILPVHVVSLMIIYYITGISVIVLKYEQVTTGMEKLFDMNVVITRSIVHDMYNSKKCIQYSNCQ